MMKKTVSSLLLAMLMAPAWADWNGNNNNQPAAKVCANEKAKRDGDKTATPPVVAKPELPLTPCEELSIISALNKGKAYEDDPETVRTMDNKVNCSSRGGFTLDYDDCKRVRNLYNGVVIAEQAMFAQQKIRITENNVKQSEEVAKAQKEGNLQNAALEANKQRIEQNSEMFKEQAYTYSTAVSAMTVSLLAWQGKGEKAVKKVCSNKSNLDTAVNYSKEKLSYPTFKSDQECIKLVTARKGSIFTNDDARTQFWLLNAELVKKAAAAASQAGISEKIASDLAKNEPPPEGDDLVLDKCVVNPNLAECKPRGPRTPGTGNFASGTMDFGSAGAGQAFDLNPGAAADISGPVSGGGGGGSDKVADVASPFENEAKEASGILNPAAAASISAGQQSSAPGGGGGGGGGGGSSALGDDLQGVDGNENKEPEINTSKVTGKYSSSGGGFQSVKGAGKEDANPFASMFDSKGQGGGVEEDRSIASGDIDGASSGLFQKISKRYGQIQQDKRIDAQKSE